MAFQLFNGSRGRALSSSILVAGTILAIVLAFHDALAELVHRWTSQEEYSHGFLIPFVSAWLLWMRKATLRALGRSSELVWANPGYLCLRHACDRRTERSLHSFPDRFCYCPHRASCSQCRRTTDFLPRPSYQSPSYCSLSRCHILSTPNSLCDCSCFLAIGCLLYPIVWYSGLSRRQYHRLGKLSVAGCRSLQRIALPLSSPQLELFSGLYLQRAALATRHCCSVSAIPIAIVMNGFRIGLVGIRLIAGETAMAEGALHFFEGWIVFLVCGALLLLEMYLMSLLSRRRL